MRLTFGRRATLLLAATALTLATAGASFAQQAWPQRNIKFIIPFGPGAGADISARLLQDALQKKWGQAIVIENRPGGDGIVALSAFVTANDDHTLLYAATGSFAVHPYQHEKLPYNAATDLQPIARVTNTVLAMGVPVSLGVKSLKEVVAMAKAKPGDSQRRAGARHHRVRVRRLRAQAGAQDRQGALS